LIDCAEIDEVLLGDPPLGILPKPSPRTQEPGFRRITHAASLQPKENSSSNSSHANHIPFMFHNLIITFYSLLASVMCALILADTSSFFWLVWLCASFG
jgi:hypothetical protein